MTAIELESLLSPLPGDAPSGADLQFDAEFLALEEAAAGKPEREYGSTLIPAEGPDWPTVHAAAMKLAERTRDLRVAVWLVRSGARVGGLPEAARALQLVSGLMERMWATVHPQLEVLDPIDATTRMNALRPLVDFRAALADLRAARLLNRRGSLTVRDIELVLGRVEPRKGEVAPSAQGLAKGIQEACAEAPELAASMRQGLQAVQALTAVLEKHVPAADTPEFKELKALLGCVAQAASQGDPEAVPADEAAAPLAGPQVLPVAAAPGQIATREDAIRGLERICEWIERNEPASPAPIFIRRSQSLLRMKFVDIIRDLVPDGMKQIEHFAGRSETN